MVEKNKENKEQKVSMGSFNHFGFDMSDYEQPSLQSFLKPKSRERIIDKAKEYVWSNGLLFRIIKLKVDFASAGVEPIHEDPKIEKFYKDIYEEININEFVKNAVYEHEIVGEWYPYYNFEDGKPTNLSLVDPKLIEVETVFNNDLIFMRPPKGIQRMLSNYSKLDAKQQEQVKKRIPKKFLKDWKNNNAVLLEGAKRYTNLKSSYEKYAHSPIEPIFNDLEIYRTMQQADFATAKKLKQLLLHIKIGSKDYNNGNAVDKKLIDAVMEMFNNPSKNMEVFTQYFVDAEYIIPDMDIFDSKKYEAVIQSIVNWSGVNVMVEQGGSYSQGYIKIKGLKQSVENARDTVRSALNDLNRKIAEENDLKYYGKLKLPTIKFNNNALKDDKEIRNITTLLYKHGLLSGEDTMKTFDYNFERQMKKKESEQKYDDLIKIPFEPSQGLLADNDNSTDNKNPKNAEQPRAN